MKGKITESLHILARIHDFPTEMFDENKRLMILIVDDEIDYLELIERYVASFGYDCMTAEDGEQAMECLRHHACDMVITDMQMPNMDGMELLLKVQEEFPQVATVVLSGYKKEYSFKDIIQAGAYEFIEKPVNKDVLEAKIERVFREKMLMTSYLNEIKTQKILLELLALSTKNKTLPGLLGDFLHSITAFPWLELEPKGAVFLVDEQDASRLLLKAHHNLAEPLTEICAQVPFGHCLCGIAAQTKKIVFADHIEEDHHNRFEGIRDHGHYCVPIALPEGELLGVFTLYVKAGTIYNREVEIMLETVAQTIAGIIVSKKNDERSAESERRYQAMTDSALDAIIMMDGKGCISFWNPAASRIFGYAAAEVMGKNLHDILAPELCRQQAVEVLPHFFATGHGKMIGKTVELVGLCKEGKTIPIELSLSVLNSYGERQAVGVVRDISKRKALEQEKEVLHVQLRQAQKMEAIGTLAGGIAHDFNNILGAVIGFADMAKEEVAADSQVHADLDRILTAGYRAKDLVQQILTFSRQKEEELFPVRIQQTLKETLKLLRATIPANIEIQQEIDPGCDAVMADPTQLHQVVMNLCTNAYQAMRNRGGHIRIGLNNIIINEETSGCSQGGVKPGRYVKLTVADSGEGIGKETMQHIFEPYFTTKPQGEGTGLGLSLVHGIVVGIGGTIEVESEPGQGTVFIICLPALTGREPIRPDDVHAPLLDGKNEHILLIDDESALIEVAARKLKKMGYAVTSRASSIEALEAFRASPGKFDLVITDLAMPNMTGLDIAVEMLKIAPEIPIVLATGFVDDGISDYALKIGIKKIINKPIDLFEVAKVIRQLLPEGEKSVLPG